MVFGKGQDNFMYGKIGDKCPSWAGDNVTYSGLHAWVKNHKPKPSDGKCEICKEKPFYDLANITGDYNREFFNWQYLCHKCHFSVYHSGIFWSEETRLKRSLSMRGENNPMYGKSWNKGKMQVYRAVTLEKMSLARKKWWENKRCH
jgi:hypothetical protein